MPKAGLRERLKLRRKKLAEKEVIDQSHRIINQLWGILDWTNVYSVHVYLPVTANNEVDTLPLIRAAWQLKPDLKFAVTDVSSLETRWLDDSLNLQKKVPDNFQYGLVIVPTLGFDSRGHRLGYGGGFYDRFLANQTQALTVGLCYEFGHVKKLPAEEHDIPLSVIVTEKAIYKF